jgi:hypothetical protein
METTALDAGFVQRLRQGQAARQRILVCMKGCVEESRLQDLRPQMLKGNE